MSMLKVKHLAGGGGVYSNLEIQLQEAKIWLTVKLGEKHTGKRYGKQETRWMLEPCLCLRITKGE